MASTRKDLAAAIAALSSEQRAMVMLVHVEGLDYDTVSQLLNVPMGTVASRLNRARRSLRQALAVAEPLTRSSDATSPRLAA